jgi:hypothetical protein
MSGNDNKTKTMVLHCILASKSWHCRAPTKSHRIHHFSFRCSILQRDSSARGVEWNRRKAEGAGKLISIVGYTFLHGTRMPDPFNVIMNAVVCRTLGVVLPMHNGILLLLSLDCLLPKRKRGTPHYSLITKSNRNYHKPPSCPNTFRWKRPFRSKWWNQRVPSRKETLGKSDTSIFTIWRRRGVL